MTKRGAQKLAKVIKIHKLYLDKSVINFFFELVSEIRYFISGLKVLKFYRDMGNIDRERSRLREISRLSVREFHKKLETNRKLKFRK